MPLVCRYLYDLTIEGRMNEKQKALQPVAIYQFAKHSVIRGHIHGDPLCLVVQWRKTILLYPILAGDGVRGIASALTY